jgi:hypothetical protein
MRRPRKNGSWFGATILLPTWVLLLVSARSPAQTDNSCGDKERSLRPAYTFVAPGPRSNRLEYRFEKLPGVEVPVSCHIQERARRALEEGFGLFACGESSEMACFRQQKGEVRVAVSKGYEDHARNRGLTLHGERWMADYRSLAAKAAVALGDCARELDRQFKEPEDWLAFFQAMKQERVPQVRADVRGRRRYVDGLLLPSQVLRENWGDCDSKILTFAALQKSREPLVIFYSPSTRCEPKGHVFLGLNSNPVKYPLKKSVLEALNHVEVNASTLNTNTGELSVKGAPLLRYKVMELSGPGITPFGQLNERHYGTNYFGISLAAVSPEAPRRAAAP